MLVKESSSEYNGKPAHLFECDICQAQFHRGAVTLAAANHFCSVACRDAFQATKKNRRQLVCPHCGQAFERVAAHIRVERPFCSRSCAMAHRMKQKWQDPSFRQKMKESAQAQWTPEKRQAHAQAMQGENNPYWKGGRTVFPDGRIFVRCPPEFEQMIRDNGYVLEHRLVMARHLERPLLATEVVHHKNGNVQDNRLENLRLFPSNAEHLAQTTGKRVSTSEREC